MTSGEAADNNIMVGLLKASCMYLPSTTYPVSKKKLRMCQEQENVGPDMHFRGKLATFCVVTDVLPTFPAKAIE